MRRPQIGHLDLSARARPRHLEFDRVGSQRQPGDAVTALGVGDQDDPRAVVVRNVYDGASQLLAGAGVGYRAGDGRAGLDREVDVLELLSLDDGDLPFAAEPALHARGAQAVRAGGEPCDAIVSFRVGKNALDNVPRQVRHADNQRRRKLAPGAVHDLSAHGGGRRQGDLAKVDGLALLNGYADGLDEEAVGLDADVVIPRGKPGDGELIAFEACDVDVMRSVLARRLGGEVELIVLRVQRRRVDGPADGRFRADVDLDPPHGAGGDRHAAHERARISLGVDHEVVRSGRQIAEDETRLVVGHDRLQHLAARADGPDGGAGHDVALRLADDDTPRHRRLDPQARLQV